jgi:hypothetical protein
MPVASLRWQLNADCVREIPDVQGVFTLWQANECVYVGHTQWNTSLRDRLREHFILQREGRIDASHFTWETTSTPKTREGELLAACLRKQGKLPRYNRADSPLQAPKDSITDLRARRQ